MSRAICVDMYNAITAIHPEWHDSDPEKGAVKVVLTGSAADPPNLQPLQLLAPVLDFVLGLEDGKARYCDTVLAISKAYALCGTLDEAAAHKEEIAFLQAVRAALIKRGQSDKKLTDADKQARMRQVLSNAIVSDRVVDIFEAVGLDKPNISILSEEFMQEVAAMKHRNLAVEILERLLADEIRTRSAKNVVQTKKYSDRLKDTLVKYQNRSIQTAQVIEELIAMAKEFKAAANRGEQLRLSDDELAFYEALEANEASVRDLGEEVLRTIAVELTLRLRNSTTVDWQVRESVRAKLRLLVKRILKKHKYPPDRQEEAVELVLKQAEVLSEGWAA